MTRKADGHTMALIEQPPNPTERPASCADGSRGSRGTRKKPWVLFSAVVLVVAGAGGGAWFALLFLPAIGSRKMTDLAARGDYKSARKLGAALQILHPSAELREKVRLFHYLESRQHHGAVFNSLPVEDEIAQQARGHHCDSTCFRSTAQ